MFDVDGDDFITRKDLQKLLELMAGSAMTPEAAEEVLRQTMAATDVDGDGRISFDDFRRSGDAAAFTVPIKVRCSSLYFFCSKMRTSPSPHFLSARRALHRQACVGSCRKRSDKARLSISLSTSSITPSSYIVPAVS